MTLLVALFFFLSGLTGLVLEVVWLRQLQLIFGATTLAVGTVTGSFLGGLGLGALLSSRLSDRLPKKLLVYAGLEATIGLSALTMPFVLSSLGEFQHQWSGGLLYHASIYASMRFLAVFAALALPTACMGATLPLLLSATTRSFGSIGRQTGLLYGINTLGGMTGALLAGFVFLPNLGISATTRLASTVCFAVAFGMTLASFLFREGKFTPQEESPPPGKRPLRPYRLLGLFLFLQGIIGMSLQVSMTRVMGMVLGSSVYSFTLVVVIFLLGIALGSLLYSALLKDRVEPYRLLSFCMGLFFFGTLLAVWLADDLPGLLLIATGKGWMTSGWLYPVHAAVIALVLLLPCTSLGISFPLALKLFSGRLDELGKSSGVGIFLNTAGSILGSFLAAFVLVPKVGLAHTMIVGAVFALGLAFLFSLVQGSFLVPARALRTLPWGVIALIALTSLPSWEPSKLAAGYFRVAVAEQLARQPESLPEAHILYHRDGPSATVTLERREDILTMKANGRPEASNRFDMPTQILAGLFPILAHPKEKNLAAALIGYGSGITAGAMLQSNIEKLLVVELEPRIVEAATFFDDLNHRPLTDPRTTLVQGDARTVLGYWPGDFDVIVSEPSNPWVAGSGGLFTQDFYRMMRGKLAPRGIYAQWVQLYEISPENLACVLRTFRSVFPHVQVLATYERGVDLVLLGSENEIFFDIQSMKRKIAGRTLDEVKRAGISSSEGVAAMVQIPDEDLETFIGEGPINTDDNGLIEFAGPLDAMHHSQFLRRVIAFHFETDKLSILSTLTGLGEKPEDRAQNLSAVALQLLLRGRAGTAYEVAQTALKHAPDQTASEVMEVAEWIYIEPEHWPPVPEGWLIEEHGENNTATTLVLSLVSKQWEEADSLATELDEELDDPRLTWLRGALDLRFNRFKQAIERLEPLSANPAFAKRFGTVDFYLGRAYDRDLQPRKALKALATFNQWAKTHEEDVAPIEAEFKQEEEAEP